MGDENAELRKLTAELRQRAEKAERVAALPLVRLWTVWESEYPEHGSVIVEARTETEAVAKCEPDENASLRASVLTPEILSARMATVEAERDEARRERAGLRERVSELEHERDSWRERYNEELAGAGVLRAKHGAHDGETFEMFVERLHQERDEARREREEWKARAESRLEAIEAMRVERDEQVSRTRNARERLSDAETDLAALRRRVEALTEANSYVRTFAERVQHGMFVVEQRWETFVRLCRESAALASPPVAAQGTREADDSAMSEREIQATLAEYGLDPKELVAKGRAQVATHDAKQPDAPGRETKGSPEWEPFWACVCGFRNFGVALCGNCDRAKEEP